MLNIQDFLQKLKEYYQKRDRIIALYVLFILGLFFLLISAFVYFIPTTYLDIELTREIQEDKDPAFDLFMKIVSIFGENQWGIVSIVVTAILFKIFSMQREAIFILLTSVASIVNFGMKMLVARPRPTEDLVQVFKIAHNNSFPSGHTVHYVVFFGFLVVLLFRLKKLNKYLRILLGIIFLTLIFSVPFSRVYLGVHWFTDVLAGFFLGLIFLAWLLYFYFKKPYELKK
ncbi:phosphatase PAP2 family protein [soil metagenome]